MANGQNIPAGWYRMDGDAPNTHRWWDGVQWTSETQIVHVTATPAASRPGTNTHPAANMSPTAAVVDAEPTVEYGSLLTNDLASYWETMEEPVDAAAQFSAEYSMDAQPSSGDEHSDVNPAPSFDAPQASADDPSPLHWMLLPYKQYAQFNGRSCRAEYWWFWLFQNVIGIVFWVGILAASAMSAPSDPSQPPEIGMAFLAIAGLFFLFVLGSLIPNWAVTVRRLHDTGRSGWAMLIGLIPFIGGFIVLAYLATPGNAGWNKYGQDHIKP